LQLREYYQLSGVTLLSRDEILSEKSIQVVAVESTVKDHSAHARLVLQAGKHVHVEKPPADDLNA
jgi:predicted dehydrogenase